MWAQRYLLGLCLTVAALSAAAFERPFPDQAKRGKMTPAVYPAIQIDGKTRTLTAAARIWNSDNLIEMPAALRGSDLAINYTENEQGDIDRVWILTPEEAAHKLPPQNQQRINQFQ